MELQIASLWKRIAAGILDIILLITLAVGVGWGLSWVLGYDQYEKAYEAGHLKYQTLYGEDYKITEEMYNGMTDQEKLEYHEIRRAYDMTTNLSNVILSGSLLVATLLLEFVVPLLLKNGQTVGKKAFSLGVIRQDCMKISTVQLFTRTLLGKYTVDLMLPVFIFVTLYWNGGDLLLLILLALLGISQIAFPLFSRNNCALHDFLAMTVVVDISCQRVFETEEERVEYVKRLAAEQAQNSDY